MFPSKRLKAFIVVSLSITACKARARSKKSAEIDASGDNTKFQTINPVIPIAIPILSAGLRIFNEALLANGGFGGLGGLLGASLASMANADNLGKPIAMPLRNKPLQMPLLDTGGPSGYEASEGVGNLGLGGIGSLLGGLSNFANQDRGLGNVAFNEKKEGEDGKVEFVEEEEEIEIEEKEREKEQMKEWQRKIEAKKERERENEIRREQQRKKMEREGESKAGKVMSKFICKATLRGKKCMWTKEQMEEEE